MCTIAREGCSRTTAGFKVPVDFCGLGSGGQGVKPTRSRVQPLFYRCDERLSDFLIVSPCVARGLKIKAVRLLDALLRSREALGPEREGGMGSTDEVRCMLCENKAAK